jgi:hypothetical protein
MSTFLRGTKERKGRTKLFRTLVLRNRKSLLDPFFAFVQRRMMDRLWSCAPNAKFGMSTTFSFHLSSVHRFRRRYHFTCVDVSEPEAEEISEYWSDLPQKNCVWPFSCIGVYVCPTCTETTGRRSACEFIESFHYVVASLCHVQRSVVLEKQLLCITFFGLLSSYGMRPFPFLLHESYLHRGVITSPCRVRYDKWFKLCSHKRIILFSVTTTSIIPFSLSCICFDGH